MRAVRYLGDRHLDVVARDPRPPKSDEVQIAVAYTGICGTDLHIFHGDMDARVVPPTTVGHEMSGRIAVLGEDVEGWQVGDPVTAIPLISCDRCPACDAGFSYLCHELAVIGVDEEGAMQTRWTVPANTLVRLPVDLPLDVAALVEPTSVAVHDVRRAELTGGEHVLVVGGGPIGLLISLVAQIEGADVLLSEPDASRREMAEDAGIRTIDPIGEDLADAIEAWTAAKGADVAFEVSGSAPGVASVVASLKVRGRLVMVAIHPQPREVDLFRFFWRELELVGARLYGRQDWERAIELIAGGYLDVKQLISRIEPMDAAEAAFAGLDQGGVMKILIDCQN